MKSKQSYTLNRSVQAMLIAAMLLFVAAVFGTMKAEAATPTSGTYRGVTYEITDTGVLKLGNPSATTPETLRDGGDMPWEEKDYDTKYTKDEISSDGTAVRCKWPWLKTQDIADSIESVEVVGNIKAYGSIAYIFSGMRNVKVITGLDKIDTSNVTDMSLLFYYSVYEYEDPQQMYVWRAYSNDALTVLEGYETWNTSNVKYMRGMFMGLVNITKIDVSGENFTTSNVVDMQNMFMKDPALTQIKGLEKFDTSEVTNMAHMFETIQVESLDLRSFNTSKCQNMSCMFSGCSKLVEIKGLNGFDTSDVRVMSAMFAGCKSIKTLDLSSFNTSKVGSWDGIEIYEGFLEEWGRSFRTMFNWCGLLEEIKGLENFDTSKGQEFELMFRGCKNLDSAAILNFDFSNAREVNNIVGWTTDGKGNNKIANAIRKELEAHPEYDDATKTKMLGAIDEITKAGKVSDLTGDESFAVSNSITEAKKYITADDDKAAADTAVTKAKDAENQAKTAKDALEAAKAENPQNPAKIKEAQEKYDAKAKVAEDLVNAADEAIAKAAASAEKTGDATMKNNAQAVADKFAPIKAAYDAKKANDAADAAIDTAKGALKEAKDAKTAADGVAASSPGSDAAVKAAEEATAKAEAAVKAAEDAVKAAEKTGDQAKIDAAKALKAEADKALADATKLEAEQKIKRAENNPSEENKKAAQDAANKALDAAKKAYGENSAEAQAAQQLVNNANALPATASKIGQEITVSKNVYVITKDPGATWDGEVTLKTAKNAKNVSVPKVVKHEGNSYEVNRVKAGAFRAKKIRKVTLGANIEKLDKNAFKKSKATTIVVKTKSLTKARVKGALKGSKVKTVQVKVGSKTVNKKFVKKYKKIFTKKNAGKKVTVK